MMKKLVKNMEIEHQLCHAHGSHLAVSDLLYKAPKEVVEELAEELDEEEEEEEQEGDKQGDIVPKALHGQRFPLPNY